MTDKEIAELKANQAKDKAEAIKNLNKEHDEKVEVLKKEYDEKLEAANKDKQQSDKDKEKSEAENSELAARMAMLERKDRANEIETWIKDRKHAGKMLPVEEKYVKVIAEFMAEKKLTHTYSNGDKEVKESLLDTFKALFSDEVRKTSVFKELSHQDGPDGPEEDEDAGVEATRRATAYMKENKCDLKAAFLAVFKEDPGLRQRYDEMSKQ